MHELALCFQREQLGTKSFARKVAIDWLTLCSYNIWHTWNEGLMGAFQTLREQGMLPLVQVDAEGNMR